MNSIEIDIETYSDVDLSKCGVYKYSSSPNFEILLFGFSVDGGEVEVVDVACGEEIPADILAALSDESVIKWAFNAMFERVCLSNYLGEWLEPESWKCSMVWSATLGLPLSLENVGAVLGLEKQKLSEGKELIRYFCVPCKPTKTNGGRTRNLPEHDREKWERFKEYNFRDVEAEMQIQQRLAKFPVLDFVWEEYWQDQEINDRGIGVDMEMVARAIAMDGRSKSELSTAMQELTELENLVLVYKCGQEKLNNLYYQVKKQRRCFTWRKTRNLTLRNSSSRSWICIMPEEPRIRNWSVNMA